MRDRCEASDISADAATAAFVKLVNEATEGTKQFAADLAEDVKLFRTAVDQQGKEAAEAGDSRVAAGIMAEVDEVVLRQYDQRGGTEGENYNRRRFQCEVIALRNAVNDPREETDIDVAVINRCGVCKLDRIQGQVRQSQRHCRIYWTERRTSVVAVSGVGD